MGLVSSEEQEAVAANTFADLKRLLQRQPENPYLTMRAAVVPCIY